MIVYRPYRNTDPPSLLAIWNESLTARGAYPLRSPSAFERWMLSKPYFAADALTVAVDEETASPIGFALAGFAPNAAWTALDPARGVVVAVVVRPAFRHRGVGRELLRRAQEHLTARGATTITVGSQHPANPYLFGIYGGSNSPGILDSDAEAKPFLQKLGLQPANRVLVYQRKLDTAINLADPRLVLLRRKYDVQMLNAAMVGSWFQECIWSLLEPTEFRIVEKGSNQHVARATAWELEGYGWRWNYPSAGIIDVQVRDEFRRQGLAKMLLTHILRALQDQFFGIAELQVRAENASAVSLCKSLGFEHVDTGYTYQATAD